jgi:hypothetical protein
MGWKSPKVEERYGVSEPTTFAAQVKAIVETTATAVKVLPKKPAKSLKQTA